MVRSTSTATEVVEISSRYMNRISTPFKAPRMIHAESEDVMKVVSDGQQLYVTLGDVTKTIAAHITGSDPNDPVFSLSLVPKNIEAQVLVLQLDGAGGGMPGNYGRSRQTRKITCLHRKDYERPSCRCARGHADGLLGWPTSLGSG